VITADVTTFADRLPAMLDDIGTLLTCETPSADHAAVARGAGLVAELGRRLLDARPETLVVDGVTHLRWRFGADDDPRVLVLCHQDTVWPIGSLATRPFAITDGVLTGPGCFDMKAGLVMALHAIAVLRAEQPDLPITLLVTGDEEVGSISSRELIESEARRSTAALVLEASGDGGAIKTGRKGVSFYRLTVHGRAAHAGLEPEKGANAGLELAHLALAIAQLGDSALGTSVVPTMSSAGTTTNTVPSSATLAVDSRARTVAEQLRVDAAIRSLSTTVAGTSLSVDGGPNRAPLETTATAALFALAQEVAAELGLGALPEIHVGGGSDGNFTAAVGTPTLDGLGAVGGGAHADGEHVLVAHIAPRTALLAGLISRLMDART
jgi:glutamate carboxypeptidase